jgi:hypothetical protein
MKIDLAEIGIVVNITVSKDVVFRDLSGEAVLLNLATGTYFGLNEVGARMWNLLLEHGSTEKVIERMQDEYEVDQERIRLDLQGLVENLRGKGLVTTNA